MTDLASMLRRLETPGLRRWLHVRLPILLGVVAPGLVLLSFVYRFAVNVPIYDEWNFMPAVGTFYEGGDWWPMVIEHYGEHRIVLPRLVILYLSLLTDYDVRVEQYLAALLMIGGVGICWALLRRTGGPAWAIVPIGWLYLSTAQFENLLVGWQFQIPMMNFFVVAAVYLVSSDRRLLVVPAVICAAAATFSFANGMMVWPAGLVAVAADGRAGRRWSLWIWISSAALAVTAYRWDYHGFDRPPSGYLDAAFTRPWNALRMAVSLAGNNFGEGRISVMLPAGVAVLAVSAAVLVLVWRRREFRPSLPWISLWLFSALSVAAVTLGRSFEWERLVTPSRFLTVAIFLPVGLLVLLSRLGLALWRDGGRRRRAFVAVTLIALLVTASIQAWETAALGWRVGPAHRDLKERSMPCLLLYETATTRCLQGIYVADGELVRRRAAILDRWHLGPFADPAVDALLHDDGRQAVMASDDSIDGTVDGTLDFVGQQPTAAGRSEAPVVQGMPAVVEGWALVSGIESPSAVIVSVDGTWVAATSDFAPRRDIERFFGRKVPASSFTVGLSTTALPPGEHIVTALALKLGSPHLFRIPGVKVLTIAERSPTTDP